MRNEAEEFDELKRAVTRREYKRKIRLGGRVGKGRKIDHIQRVAARDGKKNVIKDSLGRVVCKTILHYTGNMK